MSNNNNNNNLTPTKMSTSPSGSGWKIGSKMNQSPSQQIPNKNENSSPSSTPFELVSLLSAPPPSTKRVFDPNASSLKSTPSTPTKVNSNLSSPILSSPKTEQKNVGFVRNNSTGNFGSLTSFHPSSSTSFIPSTQFHPSSSMALLKNNPMSNSSTSISSGMSNSNSDINFINDPKYKQHSSSPSKNQNILNKSSSNAINNPNINNSNPNSPNNKNTNQLIDKIITGKINDDIEDLEISDDEADDIVNSIVNGELPQRITTTTTTTTQNNNEEELSDSSYSIKNSTSNFKFEDIDDVEVDPEILKKILTEQDDEIIDESITVDDILKDTGIDEIEENEILNELIKSPTNTLQVQLEQELNITESRQPMLWKFKNSRKLVSGIVVEPQSLQKISEQLSSSEIRKVVGYPTCFSITKYICIGTSHGYLMIFNYNQELISIIGGSICSDCGPVTAIDLPSCRVNEDWLISGHQSGHIILWDVQTGKPIKVIEKVHKLPLLHLKFFADGSRFISSDSSGVTNVIVITKGFMSIGTEQQLLLNGNLGQVLAISILLPGNFDHPTDRSNIVALATSRKILIISASTEGVSILNNKITRPKNLVDKTALPYLSWRRVTFNRSLGHTKPLEPILAIGWGTNIQLLQIVTAPNDVKFLSPEFIVVAEYQTDHIICGLEWLDSQTILFHNSKDEIRVFDPFALEEVESVNIKSMQLVHHSKFQSVYSFHNSIKTIKNRIYFLGLNGVFTAHILTWLERLSILISNGQWFEALCLGLDFYEGKAKATSGLSSNTVDSKLITSEKIIEMLSNLCQTIFNNNPEDLVGKSLIPKHFLQDMDPRIEYFNIFQQLALICIEFCVSIKHTNLLFGEIFNYFLESGMKSCILDFLEPYILNDRLTHLNPEVMQTMMTYYQELGILVRAEQCVLHLDISSIDFHQTVVLCRKHGLYSALIYLYNKGLDDYITPLEDMMEMLIKPKNLNTQLTASEKKFRDEVANHLLLYLKLSLSGKAFPTGLIQQNRVLSLKAEIYEYLFLRNIDPDDPTPYPRIFNLLNLETTGLLKILSSGFYDKNFQVPNHSNDDLVPELSVPNLPLNFPVSRSNLTTFNMISVLLLVMIDKQQNPFNLKQNDQWAFSFQQQGQLLCILGKVYADGLFRVDSTLLNRIIGMISVPPVENTPLFTLNERQSVLLRILQKLTTDLNTKKDFDYDKLLLSCEGNEFFKVCQYIYSFKDNYSKMITCQIKDQENKHQSFDYIRTILAKPNLSKENRETVKNTSISNLAQLILIDSVKTAQLIMDCFSNDHEKVLKELAAFPKLQYTYLQGLFKKSLTGSTIIQQYGLHISQETHELYLRLMCEFSPSNVYKYLSSNDDYPLDSCLRICQQYNNFEGAIYLLERIGDVFKALDMILMVLNEKLQALLDHFAQVYVNVKQLKNEENTPASQQEKDVVKDLFSAISLCQRNSPKLNDNENEPLWFTLFDTIVSYIQKVKIQTMKGQFSKTSSIYSKSISFLTKLVHSIINNMMGYVALPVILSRIVNEYGNNDLGDFKQIIQDMLDTCNFETIILETANDLIQQDMYSATRHYVDKLSRAYSPNISRCGNCLRPLRESPISNQQPNHTMVLDMLVVFQCNHTFHSECLGKHRVCPLCSKEKEKNTASKNKKQQQQNKNNNSTADNQDNQLNANKFDMSKYEREKAQRETAKYMERLERFSKMNQRSSFKFNHNSRHYQQQQQQQ
ncbi:hypothetical protein DICPUDRAFT_148703 [Dictyostelium purpureum]|uniref:RING-type domain-containing protein n=1 Tax=Dictyostelium purpureum TaxID=5786 RepID=F0ZBS6_DICPU|nr:uncharacterized protein DICPUDRAFT_148703 [Dictyostelium purpureum]EGC38608.1 hypothetical protein DICPUDRAFT_148703 [Dictyostelium purpureum]|eukprot:XP_003284887.1 hypothetical protein DICPUDRAFT_148703 [Dictyostelium purpureum]